MSRTPSAARLSLGIGSSLVLVLAACQPDVPSTSSTSPTASTTAAAADSPEPAPASTAVIEGHAVYRERMLLPPGSRLTVQLIDTLLADTPKAVIAEVTVDDAGPPPIAFSLPYPPQALRANGMYGLHASLRGPDGQLMFVTDARHAFDPAGQAPVELLLKRVQGSPGAPGGGAATTHHLQCGDQRVDVRLRPAAGLAAVSVSGRSLGLTSVASAQGSRYEDDLGNALSRIDDVFSLSLAGQPAVACSAVESPSPWTEAASRQVAFRAVGNEPGWQVEVGMGQTPSLRAELDYGSRVVEVARAQTVGLGYAGTAEDGSSVKLEVERTPCQDGMSGESFEARARLTVDARAYQGCGAFLAH